MSQDYAISVVEPVFVYVQETGSVLCQLQDVWGRVPVKEMLEVLESEWATEQGWVAVRPGQRYELPLHHDIVQSISINELGRVTVERAVTGESVSDYTVADVRAQQRRLLDEVGAEGTLAFSQVVIRTMELALPATVKALQHEIVEQRVEYQANSAVRDLVLHVRLND